MPVRRKSVRSKLGASPVKAPLRQQLQLATEADIIGGAAYH